MRGPGPLGAKTRSCFSDGPVGLIQPARGPSVHRHAASGRQSSAGSQPATSPNIRAVLTGRRQAGGCDTRHAHPILLKKRDPCMRNTHGGHRILYNNVT